MGIKTKVLECMAYGRPAITTVKGIEGIINYQQLDGVYVVSDVSNIDAYVNVLTQILLKRGYENLREYVKENYSITSSCRNLLRTIQV